MTDDLFDPRLTEHRNPRTAEIDRADPLEIVDLINAEDRHVPEAVHAEREPMARAVQIAMECFKRGGRLIYVGAGTSGRLGVLDATECPPTFGSDPEMVQGIIAGGHAALVRSQEGAEDRPEDGATAMDVAEVGANDFVFGIATSSTTPYVRGALQRAVELGARTGFLCCTEPGQEMRELVDVCVVPLVGPEVIAGSTRMKAGTATKLVLNTITTGAMIRLGKVYGNLMVDLKTMSRKLVDRSQRIVMAATGCSRDEAARALDAAGGSAKLAIVMKRSGLSRELGELTVAEADGFVHEALARAEAAHRDRGADNPFRHYPGSPSGEESLRLAGTALRTFPERLDELVSPAADARLSKRPADDRWCVKEQIEHLIDVDGLMSGRITAILTEDSPRLANRDDEVENRKVFDSGARSEPIGTLLQRLADGRAEIVARFESASAAELGRNGRHELFGAITVYQIVRHLIWHDHRHLEAIRRLLSD